MVDQYSVWLPKGLWPINRTWMAQPAKESGQGSAGVDISNPPIVWLARQGRRLATARGRTRSGMDGLTIIRHTPPADNAPCSMMVSSDHVAPPF